jgi:peptidoglycan/LPS O-acetylase OafA/YrhL
VELFFVRSGFLITSLLIAEWSNTSRIRLSQFWVRRARRLLPALFVLVLVIGAYYTLAGSPQPIPGLKGSALATVMYVGNWHQIASGSNYFVATGPLSPLQHTWSLAIEEQFYLIWPLLLVVIFWLVMRMTKSAPLTQRRSLQAMLMLTAAGVSDLRLTWSFSTTAAADYSGSTTAQTRGQPGCSPARPWQLRSRSTVIAPPAQRRWANGPPGC